MWLKQSQYCGHWSSADVTKHIRFRKPKLLEAWECRQVQSMGLYEIMLKAELAKMKELIGAITLSSGVQAWVLDKSLMDSLEGTVVWEYDPVACPQMIVQLFKGLICEGSTAVV